MPVNRSPPALSAVADTSAAAQSEERIRNLENEISGLRNSISAVTAGQNETNQLILTLIQSQRPQNANAVQHNTATSNSQSSAHEPSPSPRAPESKSKPRTPDDFSAGPDNNAQIWLRQMQTYLELVNEEPTRWVKTASSYLTKDALIWWESFIIHLAGI